MDSRQAKEILVRYRPGETNNLDQRMGEALELARHDPKLAAWFEQHCVAHAKLPGELAVTPASAIPPPTPKADHQHIIPLNKPALIMIAMAGLVLLGAFLWSSFAPKPQNSFASYRDRMARLVQRSYPMKMLASDQSQIREYFRANGGPVDFVLPRNLDKLSGTGGAVFTWHNQPVFLLGLEAGVNTNLYLFLVNRSAFLNLPVPTKPEFKSVGKLMTASWTVGDKVYLLAGPNDEATLKNYLE